MLDSLITLGIQAIKLGLEIYKSKNDTHEQILKTWEELVSKADELDATLKANRVTRDAETLALFESMKAK
jgi:hypothetical protein